MTEAACKETEALEPQSPCARESGKNRKVDDIIREEIEKVCNAATLAEMTRILLLVTKLKKTSGKEKEAIKSNLNTIAEELMARVETESGKLRLSKTCRHLLLDL